MGDLNKYNKKRNFSITSEPVGKLAKLAKNTKKFVVQRHDARNLHYDFRLEMDGVLKSFAVPKIPPLKPNIKRLAVQTEDHPLEYAEFEGIIPKGEYGAGVVEIWDHGEYELLEQKTKSIKFKLFGQKMKGEYVLVNIKENNWLLFKKYEKATNKIVTKGSFICPGVQPCAITKKQED